MKCLFTIFVLCLIGACTAQNLNTTEDGFFEVPEKIVRDYPYRVGGDDLEGRKYIITEIGKWDLRKAAEQGYADFVEKHMMNGLRRLQLFSKSTTAEGEEEEGLGVLVDMDGFSVRQMASPGALQLAVKCAQHISSATDQVAYVLLINANFASVTLFNLVRPTLGKFAEKVEIFGTNRVVWMPQLLQRISRSQLPKAYGGKL